MKTHWKPFSMITWIGDFVLLPLTALFHFPPHSYSVVSSDWEQPYWPSSSHEPGPTVSSIRALCGATESFHSCRNPPGNRLSWHADTHGLKPAPCAASDLQFYPNATPKSSGRPLVHKHPSPAWIPPRAHPHALLSSRRLLAKLHSWLWSQGAASHHQPTGVMWPRDASPLLAPPARRSPRLVPVSPGGASKPALQCRHVRDKQQIYICISVMYTSF